MRSNSPLIFSNWSLRMVCTGSVIPASGRQEMLENLINDYMD